ncbi:Transcription factor mbp1, partial [Tieghemiomyces parasiticus]
MAESPATAAAATATAGTARSPVNPSTAAPPANLYRATYAGVHVFQYHVGAEKVMRRQADGFVNATQILKLAGYDKPKRTRILERTIHPGPHEKVQGGYGLYQGTWVPLPLAIDLCHEHGVFDQLRVLLEYEPTPVQGAIFEVMTSLSGDAHGTASTPRRDATAGFGPSSLPPVPKRTKPRSPQSTTKTPAKRKSIPIQPAQRHASAGVTSLSGLDVATPPPSAKRTRLRYASASVAAGPLFSTPDPRPDHPGHRGHTLPTPTPTIARTTSTQMAATPTSGVATNGAADAAAALASMAGGKLPTPNSVASHGTAAGRLNHNGQAAGTSVTGSPYSHLAQRRSTAAAGANHSASLSVLSTAAHKQYDRPTNSTSCGPASPTAAVTTPTPWGYATSPLGRPPVCLAPLSPIANAMLTDDDDDADATETDDELACEGGDLGTTRTLASRRGRRPGGLFARNFSAPSPALPLSYQPSPRAAYHRHSNSGPGPGDSAGTEPLRPRSATLVPPSGSEKGGSEGSGPRPGHNFLLTPVRPSLTPRSVSHHPTFAPHHVATPLSALAPPSSPPPPPPPFGPVPTSTVSLSLSASALNGSPGRSSQCFSDTLPGTTPSLSYPPLTPGSRTPLRSVSVQHSPLPPILNEYRILPPTHSAGTLARDTDAASIILPPIANRPPSTPRQASFATIMTPASAHATAVDRSDASTRRRRRRRLSSFHSPGLASYTLVTGPLSPYSRMLMDFFNASADPTVAPPPTIPAFAAKPHADFRASDPIDDALNTTLHWAALTGRADLVPVLIAQGLDGCLLNQRHETALACAVQSMACFDRRAHEDTAAADPYLTFLRRLSPWCATLINSNGWSVFHFAAHAAATGLVTGPAALYYVQTTVSYLASVLPSPGEVAQVVATRNADHHTAWELLPANVPDLSPLRDVFREMMEASTHLPSTPASRYRRDEAPQVGESGFSTRATTATTLSGPALAMDQDFEGEACPTPATHPSQFSAVTATPLASTGYHLTTPTRVRPSDLHRRGSLHGTPAANPSGRDLYLPVLSLTTPSHVTTTGHRYGHQSGRPLNLNTPSPRRNRTLSVSTHEDGPPRLPSLVAPKSSGLVDPQPSPLRRRTVSDHPSRWSDAPTLPRVEAAAKDHHHPSSPVSAPGTSGPVSRTLGFLGLSHQTPPPGHERYRPLRADSGITLPNSTATVSRVPLATGPNAARSVVPTIASPSTVLVPPAAPPSRYNRALTSLTTHVHAVVAAKRADHRRILREQEQYAGTLQRALQAVQLETRSLQIEAEGLERKVSEPLRLRAGTTRGRDGEEKADVAGEASAGQVTLNRLFRETSERIAVTTALQLRDRFPIKGVDETDQVEDVNNKLDSRAVSPVSIATTTATSPALSAINNHIGGTTVEEDRPMMPSSSSATLELNRERTALLSQLVTVLARTDESVVSTWMDRYLRPKPATTAADDGATAAINGHPGEGLTSNDTPVTVGDEEDSHPAEATMSTDGIHRESVVEQPRGLLRHTLSSSSLSSCYTTSSLSSPSSPALKPSTFQAHRLQQPPSSPSLPKVSEELTPSQPSADTTSTTTTTTPQKSLLRTQSTPGPNLVVSSLPSVNSHPVDDFVSVVPRADPLSYYGRHHHLPG